MRSAAESTPRGDRARLATMFHLASNVIIAFFVPLAALPDSIGTGRAWTVGALVTVYAVLHGLVLRCAISAWVEPRTRTVLMGALVIVTAAAWPLMVPIDDGGPTAWAWLSVFTIGASAVVWPPLAAGAVTLAVVVAGVAGALGFDESWLEVVLTSVLAGGGVAAAESLIVWMFRVLLAAEAGREAQAQLAVAEERLRVSRELHDVLGHRLTVIALKAELAGSLVDDDPPRVVAETDEIRKLATTALREVRDTVHDSHSVDLGEQLRAAELVLTSAGVRCTIEADDLDLTPRAAGFLGSVVREATTNVLRHSEARTCEIRVVRSGHLLRLTIVNDAARSTASGDGTGLAGLADRAAPLGARVHGAPGAGGTFVLEAEIEAGR